MLGASAALLAFGLGGLTVTAQSWWIVLAGVIALALVIKRLRRVFREAAENRRAVVAMSREIDARSEEHTSELQSRGHLVCRLLLEKKKKERRLATPPATEAIH